MQISFGYNYTLILDDSERGVPVKGGENPVNWVDEDFEDTCS